MHGADAWAAVSTAFSALLYLLGFATNISTLRTYYMYEYECPHAPLASSVLRDPICRAIRSSHGLHAAAPQFWTSLTALLTAHLIYAVVFWLTLDPRQHPLRLAYFLPLIHLYRLLKLLSDTLSGKAIKDLTKSQRETSSLFNAVSASAETAPQFLIQFFVAMRLGEHVNGSLDPNFHAQKIPTNLIVSLMVSLLSASYTTTMAVLSLIEKHMSFARRAYFWFLIGCHTLAAMLGQAMCSTALFEFSKTGLSIPFIIYDICGVIIAWLFIDLVLQSHQYSGHDKNKYLRIAHSFGLGMMTRFLGPIYVIVKFSKSPRFIIWGTILHIFAELIGFTLVFVLVGYFKEYESPCHSFHAKNTDLVEENKYLTCKVFISTMFLSLFIFILTTLLFFCLESGSSTKVAPCTSTNNACDTHKKLTFFEIFTVNRVNYGSRESKEKNSHQMSATTFFTLIWFVISILFMQKLKKKHLLKSLPSILR